MVRQGLGLCVALMVMLAGPLAFAKGLKHDWPVTADHWGGTELTAQGSAKGRGLTATISDPIPLGTQSPAEVFDEELDTWLAEDRTVRSREDLPRLQIAGLWTLYSTISYSHPKDGDRIALVVAWPQEGDEALRVVIADGPNDQALMDHYSGDIIAIAQEPEAAIDGTIMRLSHDSVTGKTAQKPQATPETKAKAGLHPAAPEAWKRKVFTDAAMYQPTFGELAVGSKTGYFEIMFYNLKPLGGRNLDSFLGAFVNDQEQYFDVRGREEARMEGRHRAWDFLRARTPKGVWINISYLAFQTGEDSVQIVREVVTDGYYKSRSDYMRGISEIYAEVERETNPGYRSEVKPADVQLAAIALHQLKTETRGERRARQKRQKAARSARLIASISAPYGKGLAMEDIHGLFVRSDYLDRAYKARGPRRALYILLKDGRAYVNPTLPPAILNVSASTREEPGKWLSWRKTAKGYEVKVDGKNWTRLKGSLAAPAPKRTIDFNGRFIAAWGDLMMGTAGHSMGGISLSKGGRFETSSSTIAGNPGIAGLPSATVSVSKGKGGTQSTTSSTVAPALLNNTKRNPNGTDYTGQYALDGYTAEFLTDSGKLRYALVMIPSKGAMYVDGRHYTLSKR